ncbi:Anoctamin [Carpediemonas membranifera]|uniref:Anoctamin n=1 Tax=Carpediemonas membranifera TaxID=201153 RepID=A0A8J6B9L1_9EUKA|nr:Anoctamin [Carpediemonas membranifera]|eukprot:KAG9397039.1 Anoctamin [Carpediemonas membranifera]
MSSDNDEATSTSHSIPFERADIEVTVHDLDIVDADAIPIADEDGITIENTPASPSLSGFDEERPTKRRWEFVIVFTPKKRAKTLFQSLETLIPGDLAAIKDANGIMARLNSHAGLRRGFVEILTEQGLDVKQSAYTDGSSVIVRLGASKATLMNLAEKEGLVKVGTDGWTRRFTVASARLFRHTEHGDLFTARERQELILNAVYTSPLFKHSQGFRLERVVAAAVPLHNPEELAGFYRPWLKCLTLSQHAKLLDRVDAYMGEEVAFYFAFMVHYTRWLIPLTVIGGAMAVLKISSTLDSSLLIPTFDLLVMVWMMAFLEVWRRHEKKYAYRWGTLDKSFNTGRVRPQFDGRVQFNENTGRYERVFPPWKRRARQLFVSLPAQGVCLGLILLMLYIAINTGAVVALVPYLRVVNWVISPLLYGIFIPLFRAIYRRMAIFFNGYENHETVELFEMSLAWKLFIVHFITINVPIAYAAFVVKSADQVRSLIIGSFVVSQFTGLFAELFMPLLKKFQAHVQSKFVLKNKGSEPNRPSAVRQYYSWVYYRSDDMVDMTNQICAIVLLSHPFPLVAGLALINNMFEIKTDMFKLVRLCQRPVAAPSQSLYPWSGILLVISFLAVITNALYISGSQMSWFVKLPASQRFIVGVVIEHIVIVAKVAFIFITPATPRKIAKKIKENRVRQQREMLSPAPTAPALSILLDGEGTGYTTSHASDILDEEEDDTEISL